MMLSVVAKSLQKGHKDVDFGDIPQPQDQFRNPIARRRGSRLCAGGQAVGEFCPQTRNAPCRCRQDGQGFNEIRSVK
jgi:hypothetical protein